MRLSAIFIAMFCLVLAVGCSSTEERSEKQGEQTTQGPTEKGPQVSKTPAVPWIQFEVAPKEQEPTTSWKLTAIAPEDADDVWLQLRKIYIQQYLKSPRSIVYALIYPVSRQVSSYLEEGYGVHWIDEDSDRNVELGFLYARMGEIGGMENYIAAKEKNGRNSEYYILAYSACWRYCMNGHNAKAKAFAERIELKENLEMFALGIPADHLAGLYAEMGKASTAPEIAPAAEKAPAAPAEKSAETPAQQTAPEMPAQQTGGMGQPTSQPAEQAEQPAEQVEQPAEQAEQPAEQAEQPAEQAEQPAEGTEGSEGGESTEGSEGGEGGEDWGDWR